MASDEPTSCGFAPQNVDKPARRWYETIEHHVHFLFVDNKLAAAVLFSTDMDQTILRGREALADRWDPFRYLICSSQYLI